MNSDIMKKYGKKIIPLFALISVLTVAAVTFNYTGELYKKEDAETGFPRTILVLSKMFSGYSIVSLVLVIGLILILYITWLHKERHQVRISKFLAAVSSIFGILNVCGLYMYFRESILRPFDAANLILTLFLTAGWGVVFYLAAYWVMVLFDVKKPLVRNGNKWLDVYDKHVFLFSAGLILLCWLPWIISYYPASMDNDVIHQLDVVMNYIPRTNHHPWLTTFILGAFYKLGLLLQNENLGIFLFILVRDVIIALMYASCSRLLHHMNCPRWTYCLSTVFYAMTPVFGAYSKHAFKDTFGAAIFCFFIVLFIDLIRQAENDQDRIKSYLFTGLTGLLACLSRHNYIYCLLPAAVLFSGYLLIHKKKAALKSLLIIVCVLSVFAANSLAERILDIAPTGMREAMSLPLQQIARVVAYHESEISESDREQLKSWLGNYDTLQAAYNPVISDPVKDQAVIGKQNSVQFAKVWLDLGRQFPWTYFEATVAQTSGYYAFTPRRVYDAGNWNANLAVFDWIGAHAVPYKDLYDFHYNENTEGMRHFLHRWVGLWDSAPVLSVTDMIPFYTWGIVLIGYWLIKKKRFIALIPVFGAVLCILTCIASPVNDCFRYYAPVAASFPALTALVFQNRGGAAAHAEKEKEENG